MFLVSRFHVFLCPLTLAVLLITTHETYADGADSSDQDREAVAAAAAAAAAGLTSDLSRPDIIDSHVLVLDQGVDAETAGPSQCRHHGIVYRHGQLLKTSLTCYKVLCSNGQLSWVPDTVCCPSDDGLQPQHTRQTTNNICMLRICVAGRWSLRPDYDLCCEDDHQWYPVGSTRPMHGGPCTYQLCHNGVWDPHYNTSCCYDEVGWHTSETVLFTADPCQTKTCRDSQWSVLDTCCHDPATGRNYATGDINARDTCSYQLCRQGTWHKRTAFSCCETDGKQYEHGALINLGSTCSQDRCVDGSWHVVRRERLAHGPCGNGWAHLDHRCVKQMSRGTWHEGKELCRKAGGTLMAVTKKEEWRELEKANNKTIWLGVRGHEFSDGITEWRWVDGTPLTAHVLWAPHEPVLRTGHVCAFSRAGRAYSTNCDQRHLIICSVTRCEH